MDKKAAIVTSKPTTVDVLGTLFNPLQSATGNIWSPFADKFPISQKSETAIKYNAMLFHAAALAFTYGLLGYTINRFKKKINSDLSDYDKIKAMAMSKYKVISPDLNLKDLEKELKLQELGTDIFETKEAADKEANNLFKDIGEGLAAAYRRFTTNYSPTLYNTGRFVVPLLTALSALSVGLYLSTKEKKEEDKKEMEKELLRTSNILDYLNYKKLEAARPDFLNKEGEDRKKVEDPFLAKYFWGSVGLIATLSALVAGYYTKKYFDERDENRIRLKAIKDAMTEEIFKDLEYSPTIIPEALIQNIKKYKRAKKKLINTLEGSSSSNIENNTASISSASLEPVSQSPESEIPSLGQIQSPVIDQQPFVNKELVNSDLNKIY